MERLMSSLLFVTALCGYLIQAQPFFPDQSLDGILNRPIDARQAGLDMMGGAGAGERFSNGLRNGWDGSPGGMRGMGPMGGGHGHVHPPPMPPMGSPVNPGMGGFDGMGVGGGVTSFGPGPVNHGTGTFIPLSMTGAGKKSKQGLGKKGGKSMLRKKLTGTLHAIQNALKSLDHMGMVKPSMLGNKPLMIPKKPPIMPKKKIFPKIPMFPKKPPMFPKKPIIPKKPIRPIKPIMPMKPIKQIRPMKPIMPIKPKKPFMPPPKPFVPNKKPFDPFMPKKGPIPYEPLGPMMNFKPKPYMGKHGKPGIKPIHAHDPFIKGSGFLPKTSIKMGMSMKGKLGKHVGKNIYGGY